MIFVLFVGLLQKVARAEAQTVRILVVEVGCLKMSKTMALKIDLPIVGVVRLQQSKSEFAIQGPLYTDFIYQLSPVKCLSCFLREGGWGWIWNGSSRRDGDFSKFSEVTVDISNKFQHS